MLLAAMEEVVREHFRVGAVENIQEGRRKRLITAVSTNDKALFHCCTLTAEKSMQLVSMWITIILCGFSFASTFIEMYKLDKKKGIQRSKALRKDIS